MTKLNVLDELTRGEDKKKCYEYANKNELALECTPKVDGGWSKIENGIRIT